MKVAVPARHPQSNINVEEVATILSQITMTSKQDTPESHVFHLGEFIHKASRDGKRYDDDLLDNQGVIMGKFKDVWQFYSDVWRWQHGDWKKIDPNVASEKQSELAEIASKIGRPTVSKPVDVIES